MCVGTASLYCIHLFRPAQLSSACSATEKLISLIYVSAQPHTDMGKAGESACGAAGRGKLCWFDEMIQRGWCERLIDLNCVCCPLFPSNVGLLLVVVVP